MVRKSKSSKKHMTKQPEEKGSIFCALGKLPILKKLKKKNPRVAVVRLEGVIGSVGMFKKGLTAQSVDEDLVSAFETKKIKAVAIQVNSPGGSPVQSELIHKRIRELAAKYKKPVYVFAEDVAASGGYELAISGDEVYVSENTIIGSIGVIASMFGFDKAIKKVGVERRIYTQGENKSVLDPFMPENPKDIKIITKIQKDVHDNFKNLVKERRGNKLKTKDEKILFSGEFWSGKQGVELGLADAIGDMHSIITKKYGRNVEFIKIQKPKGWLKSKLGMSIASGEVSISSEINDAINRVIAERSLWGRYGL